MPETFVLVASRALTTALSSPPTPAGREVPVPLRPGPSFLGVQDELDGLGAVGELDHRNDQEQGYDEGVVRASEARDSTGRMPLDCRCSSSVTRR